MATQLSSDLDTTKPLGTARMAAHAWRGHCLLFYARAEAAVSLAIARLSTPDTKLASSHMVGHRFRDLKKLLATDPAFRKALCAAEAFDDLHRLRRLLCHGTIEVTGTGAQRWRARLHMTRFEKGAIGEDAETIDSVEAETLLRKIQAASSRLVCLLAAVKRPDSTSN